MLVPVLAIDQLIKVWIKTSFTVGERMDFVPGILELQFIENEGMAFGWALPGVAGKLLLTGFRLGLRSLDSTSSAHHRACAQRRAVQLDLRVGRCARDIVDSAVYGRIFSRSGWGRWRTCCLSTGRCTLVSRQRRRHVPLHRDLASWFIERYRTRFPPIWNLADAAISVSVILMLLVSVRTSLRCAESRRGRGIDPISMLLNELNEGLHGLVFRDISPHHFLFLVQGDFPGPGADVAVVRSAIHQGRSRCIPDANFHAFEVVGHFTDFGRRFLKVKQRPSATRATDVLGLGDPGARRLQDAE